MVSLTNDSLKILLPAEAVKPDFKYFSVKKPVDKNTRDSYLPGLQSIKPAKGNAREAVIEISSKILSGPSLLHRHNIDDVFNRINESGLITILPGAIEHACCLTIDPATDIIIPNSKHLLKAINMLAYHAHYRKSDHRRSNNTTFYYTGSKRSKHGGKAVIYDKYGEDQDGIYPPDTIRFELNCSTSLAIQHCFGVGADRQGRILLKHVLESTANPVADKFDKILGNIMKEKVPGVISMGVTSLSSDASVNKEVIFRNQLKKLKDINTFNMVAAMHFDLEQVYKTVRSTLTSRVGKAKVLAPYLDMLNEYNKFEKELTLDYKLLMEARELLRNPVSIQDKETQSLALAA